MDHEFPDVVELNVGGVHYQTLLTTLTSQEGSELAAMFSGRVPVFKDNEGRFFLDADGKTFKFILEFLRYDSIKDIDFLSNNGTGFGNTFGARANALDIHLLYRDAMHFGLQKLVQALEEYKPIFIRSKVEEYKKSIPNFDEIIKKILNSIGAENMLGYDQTGVLIAKDFQGGERPCCDHVCREVVFVFGRNLDQRAIDVVKFPFKMTVPLFKCLCESLGSLGYHAHGRVSKCGFVCQKQYSTGGVISFVHRQDHCCQETIFMVEFTWNFTPLFGSQQGAQPGFTFGTPAAVGGFRGFGTAAANKGETGAFGYGAAPTTGGTGAFGFGAASTTGGTGAFGFGAASTTGGAGDSGFGAAPTTTFGFGGAPQQSAFGSSSSSTGFSFGSAQPQGSLFGGSNTQQSQNKPVGLFGSSQNNQPANQGIPFGARSSSSGGFSFGGNPGSSSGGLFGKPKNVGHTQGLFGSANTNQVKQSFSFATASPSTTAPSFGSARGFGKAASAFVSTEKKPASSVFSFGQTRFGNSGQTHVFGGPPAFSSKVNVNNPVSVKAGNGNTAFGAQPNNASGFTSGQQEVKNPATSNEETTNASIESATEALNGASLKDADEETGPESPDEDEKEEISNVSNQFGFATDIPNPGFGLKCQRFADK